MVRRACVCTRDVREVVPLFPFMVVEHNIDPFTSATGANANLTRGGIEGASRAELLDMATRHHHGL